MFDDDFGADAEAIESARMDADLEQADMDAAGDALYAACDEMGICLHGVVAGHGDRPDVPEGHQRCRFCRKVATPRELNADRTAAYARLEEAGVL
ncbi:hypothetical protein SAMN05421874_128124 [Nonomuraea maritima]|uniref:Uncharacterized protein n=1 Tax=Nonomuraea maritima TaxID=683260 RepID=A0A1G9MP14_9ACTN|nr:hypothetical protein [Nonomuraea maritima]SDL76032.1 hypothetical protein SAMN05421874_128124 [Nonomuraea maritima]